MTSTSTQLGLRVPRAFTEPSRDREGAEMPETNIPAIRPLPDGRGSDDPQLRAIRCMSNPSQSRHNVLAALRCTGGAAALRLCVLLLVALTAPVLADEALSPAEQVRRANQALADGDFEQALEGYRQAEVLLPDAPELAYNQAIAHYRAGDLAKAREQFSAALATRDLELEAKIKFNLGACRYAEALEKLSSLQEAIDLLRSAIEHYVDVLELEPDDADARVNIETAQLLIKDLLDKLKNQQEQEQDQQQQDCEQPQEQDGDPSEEEQQEDSQSEEQQQQQEGEEQQPQPQPGEAEQEQEQQQQQQAGETKERQLTEEEAQRLLQAVRDKEQQRRDEQARRRQIGRAKVTKDW
ncbi:MAG: hypothetical protein GY842_21125 [bacterium]|nr:hypothetical protein [bacterium]